MWMTGYTEVSFEAEFDGIGYHRDVSWSMNSTKSGIGKKKVREVL